MVKPARPKMPGDAGPVPRIRATPQQLRVFEAVARLGSFRRAAEELHLAPPTVSIQMRELAEQLDETLIEVVGRRARLTPAGDALLVAARAMFDAWNALQDELAELRGLKRGRVRLAAVTTAEYFLPALLGSFVARYPGIEVLLGVENRDQVVRRLADGSVDLAVMMLPPTDIALQAVPFLMNELVVIGPLDGSIAVPPADRLSLADLAALPWLAREQGSGTRRVAEDHFRTVGFVPRVRMALGSNEAVKRGVAAGLGLAVVSRYVLAGDPCRDGVAVLPVAGFPLRRRWLIVHPAQLRLPAAAAALLDHLQLSSQAAATSPGCPSSASGNARLSS